MKKTLATICLIGSTLAVSACNTTGSGNVDIEPPYAMERTATHASNATATPVAATPTRVAPAEKVFQKAQTK